MWAKMLAWILGILAIGCLGMGMVLSTEKGAIEKFFAPQLPATYTPMFWLVLAAVLLIGAIAAFVIGGAKET
jgi:hypothetical protein